MEISVVIPAYNAAAHLEATLASVAAQLEAPAEVIVVDDGSTDATAAIAAAAGAHVIRQANGGVSAARNAGVGAARSDWIAFLDADDRWLPAFTARVSAAARYCPDVAAIFTDYALEDPAAPCASWFAADRSYRALRGYEIAPGVRRFAGADLALSLVHSRAFISTSALVIRRAALSKCGGFDESLRRAEDLELMLRLLARATAVAVEEPLSVYRKHGANLTADETACAAAERRVWRTVIGAPERYGYSLERALAKALPAKIRNDGLRALRQGRFADAVADLREAADSGDTGAAWVCSLARAANSHTGRTWYPRLRSVLHSLRALAQSAAR
ncbi:MAG: glycosyltransferase [Candidatus Lustribacter sp.]|jgi:glycosyltransferase involved in cell wall biosynthesis